MKKFINLIAFAALLFAPALATAQADLTVADGTTTNDYIPVYGLYTDEAQHNQILYPADSLEEMTGGTISGLTFYMSSTASDWSGNPQPWGITVTISLGTTEATSVGSLIADANLTQVWSGTWDGTTEEISVEFDEEFTYEGGNLLVDIQTTTGTYASASFYGVSLDGASICTYSSYSQSNNPQNFLPKTMFSYIPGSDDFCYKPKNIAFSDRTNDGFTVSWTSPNGGGTQYSVFIDGVEVASGITDTFYTASGLDANTLYNVQVKNVCGAGDSSSALSGSFRTDCQNGSCDLTVQATGQYGYNPSVLVYQNSILLATVSGTQNVEICSGDSVVFTYQAPSYNNYSKTIVITDVAETELYSSNASGLNSGDTLTAIANGCPSCMPVTGLSVSGEPTTNEVTITWDMPSTENNGFNIYVNGEMVDGPLTENSYTFTGLNPSTGYTFGVQVLCDDEDASAIRNIATATACGIIHIDEDHPFFENFDAYAEDVMPNCWEYDATFFTHFDGGLFFRTNAQNGGNVVLPEFDAPISTLMISFKGKLTPCDGVIVGVLDTATNEVEWRDTLQVAGQSQADFLWGYEHSFAGYEGTGTRIALRALNTGTCAGVSGPWSLIDDISVTVVPLCMMPTQLTAHNLNNEDSTYFTWHDAADAGSFQVVWDTATASINDIESNAIIVSDTTFVIDDGSIIRGGKYVFYVRSICGGPNGVSQWRSLEFACGEVLMPATSGTVDTIVGCGFVVYDNGGPNSAYASNTTSTLVLRPTLSDDRMAITAGWFRLYSCGVTIYDGIGTNGDVLFQYNGNNEIYEFNDTLITGELGPMTVYFPAGSLQASGFEIYITCIPGVSCKKPIDVTATDITADGATISWHNGNATNEEVGGVYRVWYRPENDSVWQFVDADDSTYTFEGSLEPNTAYELYVRGICADDDSSNVVDAIHFRTPCEGESCQVNVSYSNDYYNCDYELVQNGYGFGQTSNAATYTVCSGMPLTLRTTAYGYGDSYEIVVTNAADIEMYRGSVNTTVDTVLGNPCPSCLPATDLAVSSIEANGATLSWQPMGSNTEWIVYVDDEEVGTPSDTTYAFTGLTANTVYTAGIRAFCGDGDTSVMRTIEFRTACEGGNCSFSIVMSDSYGDGWNGNAVDVYSAGSLFASATIASGNSSATETFSPCLGDSVVLIWQGGSYADETSFSIVDANDSTVLSVSGGDQCATGDTLVVFDGQCAATAVFVPDTTQPGGCDAPTNLSATATDSTITITFFSTAGLYEVGIVEGSTWDEATADIDDEVYNNTYTFTGLNASTEYTVAVRAVCDDDWDYIYSDWATATVSTTGGSTPQPAECLAPTDVHTVSVDSNRAVITWTAGGDETAWQIKVNDDGQNLIDASTTTYVMSNLTPATQYRVRVRAVCSAESTSDWSAELSFTTASGNDGIDAADGIACSLSPNPASSVVTVAAGSEAAVTIVDQSGREVYRSANAAATHRVDVSSLAKGAYFVRIVTANGSAVRKLIVK